MKNLIICRKDTSEKLPDFPETFIIHDPALLKSNTYNKTLVLDNTSKVIIEPPHTIYKTVNWQDLTNELFRKYNIPPSQFLIFISELTDSKKKHSHEPPDKTRYLNTMMEARNMLLNYFVYEDFESLLQVTEDFLLTNSPETFSTSYNQNEVQDTIIT